MNDPFQASLVFRQWAVTAALLILFDGQASAQPYTLPRCEIVPVADHQVSLRIDGREKLRWNFDTKYPRPFFYPFNGPSGQTLTRMGHPGAPDHDHHRSVWFAHHKVDGLTFWSDNSDTKIRQTHWYRYRDGNDEAVMATHLSWIDGDGVERMKQDVVVALMPIESETGPLEHAVEFQLTFRPGQGREKVTLEQTNFGILAVRVAASISAYFGGGRLTNDDAVESEKRLHEKRSRWMDYSGPVAVPIENGRKVIEEGITFYDHPGNLSYPTYWHVRKDGWMGAAPGMNTDIEITNERPFILRYLMHCHSGPLDLKRAEAIHGSFKDRPGFRIRKPNNGESHRHYEVERLSAGG